MKSDMYERLTLLADGAKYDVSCSSSGVSRKNKNNGLGNSQSFGICHTWAADGRCISLMKLLMTNNCIYNCAYCVNRAENDIPRASLSPEEIASLTMEFYRRNYIEGLFLSSAIEKSADQTMERMYQVLHLLRNVHNFNGYIHIKVIPGSQEDLVQRCGLLADRMSVNMELPSKRSLSLLAPQKDLDKILNPIKQISRDIIYNRDDRKYLTHTPKFVPAGQSTQVIIGATPDTDRKILSVSEKLYSQYQLKRVYYSAYVPVNEGPNLPSLWAKPPMLREHRLYQADWLLRFYGFTVSELFSNANENMDIEMDPKLSWALGHLEYFPLEINRAPYSMLIRVPGIGDISAKKIIAERRVRSLDFEGLKRTGCVLKKAQHFVLAKGKYYGQKLEADVLRKVLADKPAVQQISIWG
ncbi:putative DNA modification/repair radical SAM protein [Alkalibacter mobilis]|uniref:putative DNA modification/repair radical SAM protein n=1 Tax=Alkalibacter mobilis TaxID=2787712 RepID=UPI00189D3B51|nr:putative DNA modification/repair radical SAM protein [Alkalibacter mobilis]MBF7096445.1 putative DNA modification/repair radical SAM protein [Alkalibacter mobilis]